MEFTEIVTAVVGGALIGFALVVVYAWFLYHRLKKQINAMIEEVISETETNLVGVDIELDKGMYFCYTSKDKQFVCQGATVQEIREAFGRRFPDKTAYLSGGNPAAVQQFQSQLLEIHNENSTSK